MKKLLEAVVKWIIKSFGLELEIAEKEHCEHKTEKTCEISLDGGFTWCADCGAIKIDHTSACGFIKKGAWVLAEDAIKVYGPESKEEGGHWMDELNKKIEAKASRIVTVDFGLDEEPKQNKNVDRTGFVLYDEVSRIACVSVPPEYADYIVVKDERTDEYIDKIVEDVGDLERRCAGLMATPRVLNEIAYCVLDLYKTWEQYRMIRKKMPWE